jgi:hypothetical protein
MLADGRRARAPVARRRPGDPLECAIDGRFGFATDTGRDPRKAFAAGPQSFRGQLDRAAAIVQVQGMGPFDITYFSPPSKAR